MLLISFLFYLISGLFCGQLVFNLARFIESQDFSLKELKIFDIVSIFIVLIIYIFVIMSYKLNNFIFIENTLTIATLVISTISSALIRIYSFFYKCS